MTKGNPVRNHGRTTFAINNSGIASFRISGALSYGVNEIRLSTPGAVLEPASRGLVIMGFGLSGVALRSRRRMATAAI